MCLARLALKAVCLTREVVVDAVMATRASSTMFHTFRMSELISPIAKTRGLKGVVVLGICNTKTRNTE
jgi:hypothetical protein